MKPASACWQGKRVFLTGHSGFKGAWLTVWLHALGARVCGYSLPPNTTPSLYAILDIPSYCAESHLGDIGDYPRLAQAMRAFSPDLVIHMAAQPLVRRSYREPLPTIAANVTGTAHVLEASRSIAGLQGVLIVTTDKCYKNKERPVAYTEDDELGGRDIYSASKACAEIISGAYRDSFFERHGVPVVTARAGNVIGGGDWNEDRLIPDAVRAFAAGNELLIRSPRAVRPWQHVAEPLCGYLMLAQAMMEKRLPLSPAYNFGPDPESVAAVERVIARFAAHMPGKWRVEPPREAFHEATLLSLNSTRAKKELGWQPRFDLGEGLMHTAQWYRAYYDHASPAELAAMMEDLCNETARELP